jgi:DNA-binding protein HU-beta
MAANGHRCVREEVVNKAELVDALAVRLGEKKTATAALDAVLAEIQAAVAKGDKVSITGFGVFEKRVRAARTARNPRTGEAVKVKKTSVPAFRAGAGFKDMVAAGKAPAAAKVVKKAATKKATATKTTATKAATTKATTAKKTTAKAATKTATAKATSARKTTAAKKAPARSAAAKKTSAARKTTAARTATTARTVMKKAPARRTATASKAPARKAR